MRLRSARSRAVRGLSAHPWAAGGVIAALLVALVAGGWVLRSPSPTADGPRARVYRDTDVCLLTDAHGITAAPASIAWQGLRDFSGRTAVRVSYVPVIGAATPANAGQFLAGLVQRRCRVVVAVGGPQVAAVQARAASTPQVGFVAVGAVDRDQANVVAVSPSDPGLKDQVASAVTRLSRL